MPTDQQLRDIAAAERKGRAAWRDAVAAGVPAKPLLYARPDYMEFAKQIKAMDAKNPWR
jgi:hypothetical protein